MDSPSNTTPQLPAHAVADVRERGTIATRQLAKRQMTWLRSMPQRHIIACDATNATAPLVHHVLLTMEQRKSIQKNIPQTPHLSMQ